MPAFFRPGLCPRDPALIRYRVRLADLDRHWFEIECRIEEPAEEQRFSLPAWIPGSYLLRDFARHVVQVAATSGRESLAVTKTAAATWAVRGAGRTLIFTITVYALDQSVRGAYLDRQRGYFNGPCVFALAGGARRRADRSDARAAAAFAVRGLARRNGARTRRASTNAASASTRRKTTTSCSIIRSRSASTRASSSRPAEFRTTWSSRAVSSRTSSGSPWT